MREGKVLHEPRSWASHAPAGYVPGADDGTLEAFDSLADALVRHFERAFVGPGDWHERFAYAIDTSLDWMLQHPGATNLWFLDAKRTCDPGLQARRAATRRRLVEIATDPRQQLDDEVPGLHVEFLFGALSHAAYDELAAGGDGESAVRRVRELFALFEPLPA